MRLIMVTEAEEHDVSLDCEAQTMLTPPSTSSLETDDEEKEALINNVGEPNEIDYSSKPTLAPSVQDADVAVSSGVRWEAKEHEKISPVLLDCEAQVLAEPSPLSRATEVVGGKEEKLSSNENVPNGSDGGDITRSSKQECAAAVTSSNMCWKVLVLLAVQNCSKNLLLRWVMKDKPTFLLSTAVINVELLKLVLSCGYILLVEKSSLLSVAIFIRRDYRNCILLVVPACAYSLSMTLEYIALANIDAAFFSVLVQMKLITTAIFSGLVMRKRLKRVQLSSLIILTVGVMLCNMKNLSNNEGDGGEESRYQSIKGIAATLGIASSSGFASVYTERVIKAMRDQDAFERGRGNSLAYVQAQLALVSLFVMGTYALCKDYREIKALGFFHDFDGPAVLTVVNSAIGGLTVSAVLKFADSILKGYATSVSVVMTGVLSVVLFGTQLDAVYFLGIVNVICAIYLYSGRNLEKYAY